MLSFFRLLAGCESPQLREKTGRSPLYQRNACLQLQKRARICVSIHYADLFLHQGSETNCSNNIKRIFHCCHLGLSKNLRHCEIPHVSCIHVAAQTIYNECGEDGGGLEVLGICRAVFRLNALQTLAFVWVF